MEWRGIVTDGQGGCHLNRPMPYGWFQGSLNLIPVDASLKGRIRQHRPRGWAEVDWLHHMFPATLTDGREIMVSIDYSTGHHEVAATVQLRDTYKLTNGDIVTICVDNSLVIDQNC
jgi:CTP-dependent riboflavin kinase